MMTPTELPQNIAALSIEDIATYLRSLGWQEVPFPFPNARVFRHPLYDSGKPFSLVLPRDRSLIDASRRIRDVFDIYTALVEKTPDGVADEINAMKNAASTNAERASQSGKHESAAVQTPARRNRTVRVVRKGKPAQSAAL